uniref:Uncharacterized protein n=1 Tax=Knipowitschia caucasica TaxID=637954 RepID=A0AAV2LVB7_KNICA
MSAPSPLRVISQQTGANGASQTVRHDGSVEVCSTPAADSTVAVPPGASLPEPSQQPDAVGRLESAVAVTSRARPDIARSAAAFAISVREQCHLSQRTVNSVISGVQQYQAALLDTLRERIRRVCAAAWTGCDITCAGLRDYSSAHFDGRQIDTLCQLDLCRGWSFRESPPPQSSCRAAELAQTWGRLTDIQREEVGLRQRHMHLLTDEEPAVLPQTRTPLLERDIPHRPARDQTAAEDPRPVRPAPALSDGNTIPGSSRLRPGAVVAQPVAAVALESLWSSVVNPGVAVHAPHRAASSFRRL